MEGDVHKLKPSNPELIRTALHEAVRCSDESRLLHRLHCVLLVGVGHSCYEVAEWFGEHPRTIERWVQLHELSGATALTTRPAGGRPARLSAERMRGLERDLASPPLASGYNDLNWHGNLLARHLKCRYSVELSVRQCQRILARKRG